MARVGAGEDREARPPGRAGAGCQACSPELLLEGVLDRMGGSVLQTLKAPHGDG